MAETMTELGGYLWRRLPLALLFVNGYVVYRLLVVTSLTDVFVLGALRRGHGRLPSILLILILASATLSFFIPNAVTVLTLLPILKRLRNAFASSAPKFDATTPLTLSVIYGANIGGMGSLVGSPANLLLLGALDYFHVDGREAVTFSSWFLWSIPLVALLVGAAWLVIAGLGLSPAGRRLRVRTVDEPTVLSAPQRRALRLFLLFLGFWFVEALVEGWLYRSGASGPPSMLAVVSLLFFAGFGFMSFVKRPPGAERPLLRLRELSADLPLRGLLLLVLVGTLVLVVHGLDLDDWAADRLRGALATDTPELWVFLAMTTAVIFLTEIFSNTVVSTAFFAVAFYAAEAHGVSPITLMIAVSIASTCAFMTPIATPCNALAYGEMRGTSLRQMMLLGAVLNVVGALLMTGWLRFIVPLVYG